MKQEDWDRWAVKALRGSRLHEPSAEATRSAMELGRGLRERARFDRDRQGEVAVASRSSRFAARWGWAAAAMLVLTVGTLWVTLQPVSPDLPARSSESVFRGADVVPITPGGDVEVAPRRLAWEAVDTAAGYRAQIVTIDGIVLWELEVSESSVDVPEEARARMFERVTYSWKVEALDAAGERIARSEPVRFRIVP